MQHMVNKAHNRWVAAIMISGHLAHAETIGMGLRGTDRVSAVLSTQARLQKSAHCTCQ